MVETRPRISPKVLSDRGLKVPVGIIWTPTSGVNIVSEEGPRSSPGLVFDPLHRSETWEGFVV